MSASDLSHLHPPPPLFGRAEPSGRPAHPPAPKREEPGPPAPPSPETPEEKKKEEEERYWDEVVEASFPASDPPPSPLHIGSRR